MIVLRKTFKENFPEKVSLENGLDLEKGKGNKTHKILSKYIQPIREKPEDFVYYDICLSGANIGSLHLRKLDNNKIEFAWIDINKSHRGNKYATEVIKWCIKFSKEIGFKEAILEVPGKAPDARHIYESLGFKDTGEKREEDNSSWDGLSKMKIKL